MVFVVAFAFCYWQNDNILEIVNGPLESTQNLDAARGTPGPARADRLLPERARQIARAVARAASDPGAPRRRRDGVSAADRAAIAREARRRRGRAARARGRDPSNRERQPVTLGVAEPFMTTVRVAGYAALLLALPFLLYQAYAFVLPAF